MNATKERGLIHLSNSGSLIDQIKERLHQEKFVQPSDDELFAAEKDMQQQKFADFFGGMFNTLEDAQEQLVNIAEQALEKTKNFSLKNTAELRAKTIEEIIERQEEAEGEQFQRTTTGTASYTPHPNGDEKPKTQPITQAPSSSSVKPSWAPTKTDTKTNTGTGANWNKKPETTGWAGSQASSEEKVNGSERKPGKAMDYFDNMTTDMSRLGMQRVPFWKTEAPAEPGDDYVHRMNWKQKLKHKTRKFFKSGKGRITLKVGALLLVQFALAIVGKRYEFENAGQMAVTFTLMLASFFITRELAEEGIDTSSLGF